MRSLTARLERMRAARSTRPAATDPPPQSDAIEPVPSSFWLIDNPLMTSNWSDPNELHLRGWIASPAAIDKVWIDDADLSDQISLDLHERADVVAVYGLNVVGFRADIPVATLGSRDVFEVKYTSDGATNTIVVPARDYAAPQVTARESKRTRVAPLLRCPKCTGRLAELAAAFHCARCRSDYPIGHSINFLPEELRTAFMATATDNVSSNTYDGVAINLITRLHDGLILDCGAGSQASYYPNVVNLEIADYASTDVLAVGERLPFADSSFDAVFSFAVLEHVKKPSDCAAEIVRVLKPGGILYCQVPFLQPVHAYPNHFYNMTSQGLSTLFEDLQVAHCGSFPFGQPIFALSWMLSEYAKSLPDDISARFQAMTVAELMGSAGDFLAKDFVTQLADNAVDVLSCCNYLLATKLDA